MKEFILKLIILAIFAKNSNAQWIEANISPMQFNIQNLYFSDENSVIGYDSYDIYISKDGGKNFIKRNVNSFGISCIQPINDSNFYYANFGIYKSTNNGLNWQKMQITNLNGDTLIKNSITYFYFFSNGKGFASTKEAPNKRMRLFNTTNFGNSWLEVDSAKLSSVKTANSGLFDQSNKLYVFDSIAIVRKQGSNTIFSFYLNYGDSIYETDIKPFINEADVQEYAFKDLYNAMFLTTKQEAYTTTDGCKTFTKVNYPSEYIGKIDYAKTANGREGFYLAGSNNGSFYTRDNGQTWIAMDDFLSIRSVDFYDATTGVISTDNGKVYTLDNLTSTQTSLGSNQNIAIYPNPVQNNLNINFNGNFNATILDLNGAELTSNFYNPKSLNIAFLTNGIYLLKIETDKGTYFKKFVKSN